MAQGEGQSCEGSTKDTRVSQLFFECEDFLLGS